ncbi:MAG: hypothetical protein M3477_07030 [Gemmatimonadota bacterium]|jgi:hypothetical protein|nr:hypothetical protein [Gemmatimonadota bacterium]
MTRHEDGNTEPDPEPAEDVIFLEDLTPRGDAGVRGGKRLFGDNSAEDVPPAQEKEGRRQGPTSTEESG